ncbi:peptidase [Pseudarthrobacter phenanthrenivorans]|uniref:peptidase n=1 Tax=Pseudarthrobacter phenanthrenivorans TaxID=361575 RepID=UPI001FECE154|nr:peptidase [Pseudarthrobacter phenanthrenivorans]
MASDFGKRDSSGTPADGLNIPGVRRSPSGRIPQWAIDEALGKLQDPEPWRAAPTPAAGKRRRGTRPGRTFRWRSGPVSVLALALIAGLYFTPTLISRLTLSQALPHLPGSDVPPPGFEAASSPLGVPPATTGSTAFVLQESPDPDQPFVAYDPCRPIHYVVRPDLAPPGTDQLIQQSVAAVSAATGLQFVYDGLTSEAPSKDREAYQPDRYGKKWAPVLIAWSTPEEAPDLAGRVAGTGGSSSIQVRGEPYVYITGQVQLDAPALTETLAFPDGPALVRAIMMHELAHVVGLDHVNDPAQLMYEENSGQLDFAAGDRAGLALLGTGKCVPRV